MGEGSHTPNDTPNELPPPLRARARRDATTIAAAAQPPRGSVETMGLALTVAAPSLEGQAGPRWNIERLPIIDPSNYAVVDEVGQGGVGRVLRASDERLDRPVAIKELLNSASAAAKDRFVREAMLTARLQHPGIVPLYEAGRWPTGAPFYAMKLVSGRTLLDIVDENTTLSGRLGFLPNVLAVAEAMAYAHSERVIHRDLKPGNVLVGSFGETIVIDWGLAKDLSEPEADVALDDATAEAIADGGALSEPSRSQRPAPSARPVSSGRPTSSNRNPGARGSSGRTPPSEALTVHGSIIGTPAYMPPEQAKGRSVDERADVYALGAILYHVLTGKCPYEGGSAASVLRRVLAGPPAPASTLQPGIAEDLLAIVHKAMARDPEARYPTAKELADDLRRFQTGQIVGAHRYSRGELVRRFTRRYRAPLLVAAAALAFIVTSGAVGVRRIIAESELAREKQALAEEAERRAVDHADDLTLVEAWGALERDPNRALAWLKTLSSRFTRWPEARLIAADAQSRGIAVVLRGHTAAMNNVVFSPDGSRAASVSDDHTARLWDLSLVRGAPGRSPKVVPSRVLAGHTDEVWAGAFSADGSKLATVSKDKSLRIWDVSTGEGRVIVTGHEGPVAEVAFAGPDLVITGSDDGTCRAFDVATGEARGVFGARGLLRSIAVSPDGQMIAGAGYDNLLHVWDVATHTERALAGHGAALAGVAISPDNKSIATRDYDGMVVLWDAATGASRTLSPAISSKIFNLPPFGKIRFSPDGATLAAAGDGPFLRVWDVATGAERRLDGPEGKTSWVSFSPDSSQVAASSLDHTAVVWDLRRGGRRVLRGFDNELTTVTFSPDGTLLSAAGADSIIRLFPITFAPSRSFGDGQTEFTRIDVSPDQRRALAAGIDGLTRVWDLSTGEETALIGHAGPVFRARFSPDGQLIATGAADGTTRLWDLEGHEIWATPGRGPFPSSLEFSPDGSRLAVPGRDGAVQLIDVDSGSARELKADTTPVLRSYFSPDGRWLTATSVPGTIRVWDLTTYTSRLFAGHTGASIEALFSPDSASFISSSRDHTLRRWDVATGEALASDSGGGGVIQVIVSADGSKLFSVDDYESKIRIWDLPALRQRATLTGHKAFLTRADLAPDERRLATASLDGTVRLWDIRSGESRALVGHSGPVTDVRFSADGKQVITGGKDGTLRVWPDDLPDDPAALRAWIEARTPDAIEAHE